MKSGPGTYFSDKGRGSGEWFEAGDVAEHVQFQAQLIFVSLNVVAHSRWAAF